MRHMLNPLDFSVEEIDRLLTLASDIEHNLPKYAHVCDGKKTGHIILRTKYPNSSKL